MYTSILFPIDLEHESSWKKALPVTKALAKSFGASVHLLTVVADVRTGLSAEFLPADFETKLVAKAKERLAAFISTHMSDVGKVEARVETGRPYKAIVATAEREGCDLILMASHQPEVLDLLIGPNADHVVRQSRKSVLVVRE